MATARRREQRAMVVAQAVLVWNVLDDSATGEHLATFIDTGELEDAPDVLPYNPAVIAEIAKTWNQ